MSPAAIALSAAIAGALLSACAEAPVQTVTAPAIPAAAARVPPAAKPAVIPKGKDSDLKLYLADGSIVGGVEALRRMPGEAKLILWLAGNQFFAMDDVVRAFQRRAPGLPVGLITLPPGLLLDAILGGGWIYDGNSYAGSPDVYASVGNPKAIKGIKDLARATPARRRPTTGSRRSTTAKRPTGSRRERRMRGSSGRPKRWRRFAPVRRSTRYRCRRRTACATRFPMRSAR